MAIVKHEKYKTFAEIRHPLIQHKLTLLREKSTDKKRFNELVTEITLLMVYEVTQFLPLTTCEIETPLEQYTAPTLAAKKKPVILPILRAGLGMVDAFLSMMPNARVGHIGLFRDEDTMQPQLYYFKVPQNSESRHFYICDPMLATGGSAIYTISALKERGIKNLTYVCLVAAPEGVAALSDAHPDVTMYAASLDRQLSEDGYILPGLGDAGDRLFGTK